MTPPLAIAPFTDADVQRIAALPAAEQVAEVREELKKRNPAFDGTLTPTIEYGAVTGLKFTTDRVTDISPVRVLPACGRSKSRDQAGTRDRSPT